MFETLKAKLLGTETNAENAEDPKIEEKIPRAKEDFEVKDPNPGTFINEALWKKVAFKVCGYFFYILSISLVILDGAFVEPYIDTGKLMTGITVIILPVIWGALDAQARNKEIQDKLNTDEKLAKARQDAATATAEAEKEITTSRSKLMEKQQEIYRLKALLLAKTDNVNALDEACKMADALKGGEIE